MSALSDEEAAAQQRCPAPVRRTGDALPCLRHDALRPRVREDTQGRPGECRQVGLDLWELYCACCGRHVNSYRSRQKPHPELCQQCYAAAQQDGTPPLIRQCGPDGVMGREEAEAGHE